MNESPRIMRILDRTLETLMAALVVGFMLTLWNAKTDVDKNIMKIQRDVETLKVSLDSMRQVFSDEFAAKGALSTTNNAASVVKKKEEIDWKLEKAFEQKQQIFRGQE